MENLKYVITWNSDKPDTDDVDFSKLYIISATELNSIFKENAENNSAPQQQNEAEKVGGKRSKVSGSGSRGKKRAKFVTSDDRRDENKVPVISNGRELVRKMVENFYLDVEDKQGWHRDSRCVIMISQICFIQGKCIKILKQHMLGWLN